MSSTQPTITVDLVLDRPSTKDVLRAVLHVILFHRLFGTVKPRTTEVLDITMPGVEDAEIEKEVNAKVDAFWKAVEGGISKRGQIVVTFLERKPKKSWFYTTGEEDVPWEQWIVNAEVRQPKSEKDRQIFNANLASTLNKFLITTLTHTSSEKGRNAVPLITSNTGISPFPIKIAVKVDGVEVA